MRRNIQFALLFTQIFIGKHKKPIFIAALTGFLVSLLFIQSFPFFLGLMQSNHQIIGVVATPTDHRQLPLFIQNQLSIGLTAITPNGEATQAAAWKWETDETETIYTFHLMPNLYWHDGKKFTADDIQLSIKGANITEIDDYTFQVALGERYSPLPVLLSSPLFRPNFNGLGIYKVIKTEYKADTLTLLTLQPLDKRFPGITYKFYPSTADAIIAFKLGEINILKNIGDADDLADWKNVKITPSLQYDRFVGIFFNMHNEYFKTKEIRQAITYATPEINKDEKVISPISPLSWAYSSKVRLYSHDPETANKILSKSPLTSVSAQLTLSTFPGYLRTAQIIADAWNSLGLNVKIRVESSLIKDSDLFLRSLIIPTDPDQYHYWQSEQENANGYSNLKVDKLLEDGRITADKESRMKIYADFQRYLVDDAPVIFLYYPKTYTVERI